MVDFRTGRHGGRVPSLAPLGFLLNVLVFGAAGVASATPPPGSPESGASPRERVLISADWRVTDRNGRTVPRANNLITFSIEGPGKIVATDNGDPTSFVPLRSPEREAFNGFALAIVRGVPGRAGAIKLRARSGALRGDSVALQSLGDSVE